jgi:hypothetical protein
MKKYIIIAALALAVVPTSIFAVGNVNTGNSSKADWACVSTATGVREGEIIDAFSAFTTSMKSALETRKTALVAANAKTEKADRQSARKSAWTTFKSAKKSADSTYKSARKEAFADFKDTVKTDCKLPAAAAEEGEGSAGDPIL